MTRVSILMVSSRSIWASVLGRIMRQLCTRTICGSPYQRPRSACRCAKLRAVWVRADVRRPTPSPSTADTISAVVSHRTSGGYTVDVLVGD